MRLFGRKKEDEDKIKNLEDKIDEVADNIRETIIDFANMDDKTVAQTRKNAAAVAEKALWKHFIKYYYEAYDVALSNARKRMEDK